MPPDIAAPVNWAQMQFFLNLSNFALTVAVGLYAFFTRRDRATHDRISAVETALYKRIGDVEQAGVQRGDGHRQRLDQLLERCARVEERIGDLPRSAALAEVEGDVRAVREAVEGVETQMRGVAAQLQLIQQHLLARKE